MTSAASNQEKTTDAYNPRELRQAFAQCETLITKGSKSFSLAARIFGKETREAAFALYGWCRTCDDLTDGSVLGFQPNSPADPGDLVLPAPEEKKALSLSRLQNLADLTNAAYDGARMTDPVFIAFQKTVLDYGIPRHYPLELLEGMAMDFRKERYETLDDLLLYCYRVAGTVGLMMSHVMGLDDDKALKNAADMGIAMQLTNIARDVMEDAAIGRVYIPLAWLKESGVPADHVADPLHRSRIAGLVERLLAEAEKRYQSGDEGLVHLRTRAAFAISAARRIYSEIGRRVQKKGARAWDQRTIVPVGRKLWVMALGIARVLFSLPRRWARPWEPAPINRIWRHV